MSRRFRRLTFRDYLDFALSDLGQRKLRTFLTSFGVTVGIGALVAMIGFGKGMQKNVTDNFAKLDLFNSITVLPPGSGPSFLSRRGAGDPLPREKKIGRVILDDSAVRTITSLEGVESVFPEIRFPAMVRLDGAEEFRLIQVVPARVSASKAITVSPGRPFENDDEPAAIVSGALLRRLGISDPPAALNRSIRIASLAVDLKGFDPSRIGDYLSGNKLPFREDAASFTIVGVMESTGFAGPTPLASDILIPPGPAGRMSKIPVTNLWDLFRAGEGGLGYSAVNVRLSKPAASESVKKAVRDLGFSTFSLLDQFEQIKTSFVFMDMMMAAIGMIAIFVASLGIINTMVMSVLERTSEIGIMKAVGASPGDIQKVFIFESSTIGFFGGVFGLGLGWTASRVINRVINYLAARQGIPPLEYFCFPLWLLLGAVIFAVLISLTAGIYPARRAAKVDPAVALRHE
jgi:putative ABC transport system permease protein